MMNPNNQIGAQFIAPNDVPGEQTAEERRLELIGLAAVLFLALALRLQQMNAFLPWFIYEDELRTTEVALRLIQLRTLDPAHSFYPGLSFYINAGFYLLWALSGQVGFVLKHGLPALFDYFGGMSPADPVIIMLSRWVSLIFGMASLPVFHLLVREYLRWRWALLATLLLALNPMAISMSAVGKTDTINLFWFLIGYYTAVNYFHRGGYRWLVPAAAAAGFATITKNNPQLVFTLGLVILSRGLYQRRSLARIAFSREAWIAGLAALVAMMIGSPYSFLRFGTTLVNMGWLYRHAEILSFYHTDHYAWWRDRYWYALSVILPFGLGLPIFGAALIGVAHNVRKYALRDPYLIYNLIGFGYCFAAGSGGKTGGSYPYYMYLNIAPLFIWSGTEWLQDLTGSPRRWARRVGFAGAGLLLIAGIFGAGSYRDMFFSPYDQLGPWMEKNLPGNSRTLFVTVYKPTSALAVSPLKTVWPQDLNPELIKSFAPQVIILDTWTLGGFRKVYRDLPVARLADDLISGSRGFEPVALFKPSYLGRSYFAALDPEHDVEIVVLALKGELAERIKQGEGHDQ